MRAVSALFSILMPGFGQIYNGQIKKGIFLLVVEHFDNMLGKINRSIQLDFNGFHQEALATVIYDAMLFYPGFYVYTVWDAWFYAKEGADKGKTAIPFIIGGFLGELGAIFASKLPFPTLICGLLMIIPMLIGMVIFRKQ
ncbi:MULTISPECIES: hypothetical protein [Bacillaceae]|jgi:hypothetical protein|uniref:DUF5683 domain-containing protein n=2 Tax=Bacillaceae TaxID=186817 RepID=A0ABU9JTN7_9BACI|nr:MULTISPECIES: hypothetical protein [Bacillaceae]AWI11030.1 hypothetical protein CQJ30_01810 [Caldibacillus thermoamylovorans]MBU5340925.1 hypothetical protein [Caldifermentibacillus hisashii]MCB7071672.1 hypothetical protein [Caldibacillus sp. 210928-DFI.2.22]MCB7075092.1 hypothetical protein [Caldibacillus sp. 210928-DFI.2.18]MCM3055322.1 hypothetical protein [Caldibacillus thermoamylovorans]